MSRRRIVTGGGGSVPVAPRVGPASDSCHRTPSTRPRAMLGQRLWLDRTRSGGLRAALCPKLGRGGRTRTVVAGLHCRRATAREPWLRAGSLALGSARRPVEHTNLVTQLCSTRAVARRLRRRCTSTHCTGASYCFRSLHCETGARIPASKPATALLHQS